MRCHADVRCVDEEAGLGNLLLHHGVIIIIDRDMTARTRIELGNDAGGSRMEAAGSALEDRYLAGTIEGELHEDGDPGPAGAEQCHLLSAEIDAFLTCRLREADAVRSVSRRRAIFLEDDGIDRSGDLCGRAQPVTERDGLRLQWHREIEAAHAHLPEAVHHAGELPLLYIESEVTVVEPELREGLVVHRRGHAVGHRAAEQTDHFRAS